MNYVSFVRKTAAAVLHESIFLASLDRGAPLEFDFSATASGCSPGCWLYPTNAVICGAYMVQEICSLIR